VEPLGPRGLAIDFDNCQLFKFRSVKKKSQGHLPLSGQEGKT